MNHTREGLVKSLLGVQDSTNTFARLLDLMTQPDRAACEVYGSWGSAGRLVAALLWEHLRRPLLLITAHVPDADQAQDDLETLAGHTVELFPAAETIGATFDPTSDVACERLRLVQRLGYASDAPGLLCAPAQALIQPAPAQEFLEDQAIDLRVGAEWDEGPAGLAARLVELGYESVEQIDVVGEFAVRGGIIDVFAPGQDRPVRVEFFADEIESLRYFDLETHRSIQTIEAVSLVGCTTPETREQSACLLDLLDKNTIVLVEEVFEVQEAGRVFVDRLGDERGVFPVPALLQKLERFDRVFINRFQGDVCAHAMALQAGSVHEYEGRRLDGLRDLAAQAEQRPVYFFCENRAERQRCQEMLATETSERGLARENQEERSISLPQQLHFPLGVLHHGFTLSDPTMIIVSHQEVFGQHLRRRRVRRLAHTARIDSFSDIKPGDLVVHAGHGIGRFLGVKTLQKNERKEEYLALEYAGKAVLHVPATSIHLVHKYVGCMSGKPRLHKLGGRMWQNQKQKVAAAVEDMAAKMIEVQALRETAPGIAYPHDTVWQGEFEEAFPYQETDDQLTAVYDIKTDMQRRRPMDRLLCGDVGYGKTELAIRAAFKAVEFGKQVAVLVPTTVLAEQHLRTFRERMADFPFLIESISRFKTAKESKSIIERTSKGQVDILIGTHRILSADVKFKDLGLVVIDEEQRFGVEHKERLKNIRETVDMLTMTATPIPRTLHMALLGIRDISALETPPLDRRSIVTEVCAFDKDRIREVILRELRREGQVFFLHNRVQSIQSMADQVRSMVPDARVVVGHGQMPKRELEACMVKFLRKEADILVSTTIIESGLDIPSANTIIITEADRFGLAELHQLRGRVGRYKERAYAYMLLPLRRKINPTAAKRLKAIEEYAQLGSGFRIAMRDLEIRGAGNILGFEQSGHIDAIGYEMYCQLLANAVRRLRREPELHGLATQLELNIHSYIPRSYIPSDQQRMEAYRRLVTCRSSEEWDQLQNDLADLYGPPPEPVIDLLQLAEIRTLAGRWQVRNIVQRQSDLIFTVDRMAAMEAVFENTSGKVRIVDDRTICLRLPERFFENNSTLLAVLRNLFKQEPT